jgi:hypothetical protein
MTEQATTVEPGSPMDPERFERGYYESGRERYDLRKAVLTLSEFVQRYREERDVARAEVRRLRDLLEDQ